MRFVASGLALVLSASAVWFSGAELERKAAGRDVADELLYLPNGSYLKAVSMGQAPLLADLIYIWAIQYYSNYERADRHRYVEHVFGEVIARLDPHYIDPYWMGALILTVEAGDLEAGLRLLDQGFEANPEKWILPYLAAWESYRAGEYDLAADYFARAAAVPGAPVAVSRMRAGMISRAGNPALALSAWREVRNDPRSDPASVEIAERQIRDLQLRIDLQALTAAVARFRNENRRYPRSLEELVQRSYLTFVPLDPDERSYVYDPRTGRISSEAGRILGGG